MNIKKIAELANVSVATVSRVINKDLKVKKSTKEKVENIINQFNYTPNCHATRLSRGIGDQTIGLIVPDVGNILFSEIVEVISRHAEKEKMTMLLCNTNEEYEKEKNFIEVLIDYRVKGIIYIPGKFKSNKDYNFLKKAEIQNIPIVFLDREIEGIAFDGVFLDNYNISFNITKELLKANHNKIYFISGPLDISSGKNRYLGFKTAMEKHKKNSLNYEVKYGNFKFESGYQLGGEILKNHNDDEIVIYIANNTMALGFLKIFKKYKNKYKKIKIAIFGISEVLDMLLDDEECITCKVPNKDIAEKAFHILRNKIKKLDKQNNKYKKIFYNTTIIKKGDEF